MGITFLAAGTSVPDCMASLIVARQGQIIFMFTFVAALLFKIILYFKKMGGKKIHQTKTTPHQHCSKYDCNNKQSNRW